MPKRKNPLPQMRVDVAQQEDGRYGKNYATRIVRKGSRKVAK